MLKAFNLLRSSAHYTPSGTSSSRSFSSMERRNRVDFVYHRPKQIKTADNRILFEYEISAHHTESERAIDALRRYQTHAQKLGVAYARIVIPKASQPYLHVGLEPLNMLQFLSNIGYAVNDQLNSIIDVHETEPGTINRPRY